MQRWAAAVVATMVGTSSAWAGEVPLYEPAPPSATKVPLPAASELTDASPLMILDSQQRIEDGQIWGYSDTATRVTTVELLSQLSNLNLPWMPDKGDLIIHEISIARGDQVIDLLADGKRFSVLRREEALEQRVLTGMLTATFAVEGVRVGDILRLRYSVTARDGALGGNVQQVMPLFAAPLRVGAGQVKLQWRRGVGGQIKVQAAGVTAEPVERNGFKELIIPLPIAKQPDVPEDAPLRFKRPPLVEFSTFADWADVSKVMAPLYRTEGLILPDGNLAKQLAPIKSAATPLERAQTALQIVQDQVRYLMLGMNGGNYVPQKPDDTWMLRYGDCKAKTLLLLALLRESGIEAEAVLANSSVGDFVPERLPSAAAFDHVLVHAVIDGQDLWLDGTASGTRIEDIHDTPPFRFVLPLREGGAQLMPIAMRKPARPQIHLTIEADESTSVDLPMAFRTTAVLRGPVAAGFTVMSGQLDTKQRNQVVQQFFTRFMGEGQYTDFSFRSDVASATVTLSARGVTGPRWRWEDKRLRRQLSSIGNDIEFKPDRARTSWQNIPVATPDPGSIQYHLRLRLPGGGRGMTLDGERQAATSAAGREVTRTLAIEGDILTLDERLDTTGAEVPVGEIPAARERISAILAGLPKVIAPADALRRWEISDKAPANSTQLTAIKSIFAKSIAEREPDDISGLLSRANLLLGIGDVAGALPDLDKIVTIAPDIDAYLARAQALHNLGRLKDAIADAQKAVALDPSSSSANGRLAHLLAEQGDLDGALALLDRRIDLGGDASDDFKETKASVIGEFGDPQSALAILDDLAQSKPGDPGILNAQCWIKGTRSLMIDSALKDCTSAIELSSSTFAALDSRALVWFRLGRYDEALRDLDAALLQAPGLGPSRFMRGVVLNRLSRPEQAMADLAIARRLDPRIDATYGRYGIKP
jgi:tetratricopeptide (TPR) repeat protein